MFKRNIFFFITLCFIVTQFLPPFYYFVPIGQAMVLALYTGVSLLFFPEFLVKKPVVVIFIYTLILLMKFWNGNAYVDAINGVVVPFLNFMTGTIFLLYVKDNFNDVRFIRWIPILSILLLVVMTCVTLPILFIYPNAIRGISAGSEMEGFESFQSYFVMSYGTIHAIPSLFPLLICLLKRRKDIKLSLVGCLIIVIVSAILFFVVFKSNATTPLLVSAILVGLSFVLDFKSNDVKSMLKRIIPLLIILFVVSKVVLLPILDYLSENLVGNNAGKMELISSFVEYGEATGDLDARMSLYADSKRLFFESPIMGTDTPSMISRHTYIWDQLALLGIILAIPWALIFIFNFKQAYSMLTYTKVPYLLSLFGFLIMIYFKSGIGGFFIMFAIVPLLCLSIDKRIEQSR